MTAAHGATVPDCLLLPGVLDREQAAATVRSLLDEQRPDGSIPWFTGGHLDVWDHTEAAMALDAAGEHAAAEAAYAWLTERQNPDGSWYASYRDGEPEDLARESNFCAYPAVGVWHHYLATGDEDFAERMWPTVAAGIGWVLELQRPDGSLAWRREQDGGAPDEALLTGSSSIYHALRCALALAEVREEPQPDWELAAARLEHALLRHPDAFLDKSRYSMDWYYPVLGTALRGEAAERRLAADWERFVVPGEGARCVSDRPWVTGGETAELALALWAVGRADDAVRVLRDISARTRDDATGGYWTGWVYEDDAIWPEERTTWTAGAVLLACAALGGDEATSAVFGGERLPRPVAVAAPDCCAQREADVPAA